MMRTCCSKHAEAWNKYIKKECVKLVINQNYVEMHGQQNMKYFRLLRVHFPALTIFKVSCYYFDLLFATLNKAFFNFILVAKCNENLRTE
jgi:hypothetical protein